MKYYYKLVICKKIIQKLVSIYETNECDIRTPDIHRSFRRLTVVNGTLGFRGITLYKLFEEYRNKGASTFMGSCFSNVSQPPNIIRREREKLPTYDVSCFLINPLFFF